MRSRRGFTLVEVMVAITLTGLVALMARRLVQITIDSVQMLYTNRTQAEQAANARAWLRSALLSLEAGDSAGSFAGNPNRMEFTAWVQQPGGWLVRRRVVLENRQGEFLGIGAFEVPVHLRDSVLQVAFDYLLEPGADTKWVQQWLSPVSAPLAVRIRLHYETSSDTMLFLIRERG